MSNLAALNELRRTAKALGMTGYGRMKTADLKSAIEAEQARRDVEQSIANEAAITALRTEAETATPDRREEIGYELARMGAVIVPQGTEAHEQYAANLRAELKKFAAGEAPYDADPFAGVMEPEIGDVEYPSTPDVEVEFAAAVDADDRDAMAEILNEAAPAVLVIDPNATRYEDVEKWTKDRLFEKEDELVRRLKRRTLLGGDRKLSENRLARIRKVIESRGL